MTYPDTLGRTTGKGLTVLEDAVSGLIGTNTSDPSSPGLPAVYLGPAHCTLLAGMIARPAQALDLREPPAPRERV